MSTTETDDEQCKALTRDGERCSRPAQGDGFCHQHDSSDETVDEAVAEGDGEDAADGSADADDAGSADADEADTADGDQRSNDAAEATMSSGETQQTDIGEVRETVQGTAEGIVGHPLDGITSVDDTDEGWRVAVEVVERKSVPDTQDILGRYEITLDEELSVTGYQRTHRYRRDDMDHDI
jgi:hypothetical protein